MPLASIAHTPMSDSDRKASDIRRSVYIDELAECIYETAVLCGAVDGGKEWGHLTPSVQADYRFEAVASVNRFSLRNRYDAELRAREQVADAHYGRAFHLLPPYQQREIKFRNQTAIQTFRNVLEGHFTPLRLEDALKLEAPEEVQ